MSVKPVAPRIVAALVTTLTLAATVTGMAPAANATATKGSPLPDLQKAVVLRTVTASQATRRQPAGMTVSFQFDENPVPRHTSEPT